MLFLDLCDATPNIMLSLSYAGLESPMNNYCYTRKVFFGIVKMGYCNYLKKISVRVYQVSRKCDHSCMQLSCHSRLVLVIRYANDVSLWNNL
jgi:hypothetical protein